MAPVILTTFCGMLFSVMALKAFKVKSMPVEVAILVGVSYSFLILSKKYNLIIVIITSSFFGAILTLIGISSMQQQALRVEISPTTIAYMLGLQLLTLIGVCVQIYLFKRTQRRIRQRLHDRLMEDMAEHFDDNEEPLLTEVDVSKSIDNSKVFSQVMMGVVIGVIGLTVLYLVFSLFAFLFHWKVFVCKV